MSACRVHVLQIGCLGSVLQAVGVTDGEEQKGEGGLCEVLCSPCLCRDLQCGKLICEYPGNVPFTKEKAAVIYTRVQNTLCITLDYMRPPMERDPMLVKDGTVCGDHKVTCRGSKERRTCRKCFCSSGVGDPRAVSGFSCGCILKGLGLVRGSCEPHRTGSGWKPVSVPSRRWVLLPAACCLLTPTFVF